MIINMRSKTKHYRSILFLLFSLLFICAVDGQDVSDIQSLLSSEGKVLYGDEANSILIIDYPQNIQRIEEYLGVVDIPPHQVFIEARVVEVKLQGEQALGINWSAVAAKGGFEMGQFRVGGLTHETAIAQSIPYKPTIYPPLSTDFAAEEETPFTITIFDENINIVLQALANSFDTNILSAPRVTTVNNRKAEIKVVRELRYVIPEVTVEEGVVTLTWAEGEDSPIEVGILLEVTPRITDDGEIAMELKPEVSEHVDDLELTAIAGTYEIDYTIPIIDTRNADTKVVIGNGQTLIIGGLIKEKLTKGTTKIPILGDIPLLGWFFKSQKDTKEKIELLIFVSPTIITPGVIARMGKEEKLGIGEWYMKEREKKEKQLLTEERKRGAQLISQPDYKEDRAKEASVREREIIKEHDEEFTSQIEYLESKTDELIKKRKALEKEIRKGKE